MWKNRPLLYLELWAWSMLPRTRGWQTENTKWKRQSCMYVCMYVWLILHFINILYLLMFLHANGHTQKNRWHETSQSHPLLTVKSPSWLHEVMRGQLDSSVPSFMGQSCTVHVDLSTVLPGVGCAISLAIWVNRRLLLLCHKASPPDPALLTLGRGTATWRQMAPMVGSLCLPQDVMAGGTLRWWFTQRFESTVHHNYIMP